MKRTDLAKSLGLKIQGRMQHAPIPNRFGATASAVPDRREQRRLDQAAGLVPFAVKLHHELVARLNEMAAQEGIGVNELTARLIHAGLGQGPARAPSTSATEKPAAVKVAVKRGVKAPAEAAPAKKAPVKTSMKKAAATTLDKAPAQKAAKTRTDPKTEKPAPVKKAAVSAAKKKAKAA